MFKQVTREDFYKTIGPMDVHPTPEGSYPYKSVFKTRSGIVVGYVQSGDCATESIYFLKDNL